MHYLRYFLIALIAVLCLGFVIEFIQMKREHQQIIDACYSNTYEGISFSCDAVPQHIVGGFHFLAFIFLAIVVFSRRYLWILVLALNYLAIHLFATYERIGTGFFGGDMCPNGHPCLQAIQRASLFDWFATVVLTLAIFLILALSFVRDGHISSSND